MYSRIDDVSLVTVPAPRSRFGLPVERPALLEAAVAAVTAANSAVMAAYGRDVSVHWKSDQSPLTNADLASHRALVAVLAALSPSLPVVSEEAAPVPHGERAAWPAYWLIDPLDGTREFLARNGEFTVNVALIERSRPTLGVVGVPSREEIYTGDVAAHECLRRTPTGTVRLYARPYAGSRPTVVASRRHGGEPLREALKRIEREHGAVEVQSVGSALKFCLLAAGAADVYPRLARTSEWDTAAAQAVLEAAGGAVLQLNGEPLTYNKADILNPDFVAVADPTFNWTRWFTEGQ